MPFEKIKTPTTVQSIKSSIETDKYVRRWFLHLIYQEKAQTVLSRDQEHSALLKKIQVIERIQVVLNCALLVVFVFSLFWWVKALIFPLAAFFYAFFSLRGTKKQLIKELSIALILIEFKEEDLSEYSLYQLCEKLAKDNNIISLVKSINACDTVLRITMLISFVFASFVFPLGFWMYLAVVGGIFFVTFEIFSFKLFFNLINSK